MLLALLPVRVLLPRSFEHCGQGADTHSGTPGGNVLELLDFGFCQVGREDEPDKCDGIAALTAA